MKNHLYFHSSNLDQLKYLKEDINFYNIAQYSNKEPWDKGFINPYGAQNE
jgi:hypothetical protein